MHANSPLRKRRWEDGVGADEYAWEDGWGWLDRARNTRMFSIDSPAYAFGTLKHLSLQLLRMLQCEGEAEEIE